MIAISYDGHGRFQELGGLRGRRKVGRSVKDLTPCVTSENTTIKCIEFVFCAERLDCVSLLVPTLEYTKSRTFPTFSHVWRPKNYQAQEQRPNSNNCKGQVFGWCFC